MQAWHFSSSTPASSAARPRETYESIRVSLANGVYNPRFGADLYTASRRVAARRR